MRLRASKECVRFVSTREIKATLSRVGSPPVADFRATAPGSRGRPTPSKMGISAPYSTSRRRSRTSQFVSKTGRAFCGVRGRCEGRRRRCRSLATPVHRHPEPLPDEDVLPVAGRHRLWTLLERMLEALTEGDGAAFDVMADALEAHLLIVERGDPANGHSTPRPGASGARASQGASRRAAVLFDTLKESRPDGPSGSRVHRQPGVPVEAAQGDDPRRRGCCRTGQTCVDPSPVSPRIAAL